MIDTVLDGFAARVREKFPDFAMPTLPQSEHAVWQLLRERPAHLLPPGYADWDELLIACADRAATTLDTQHGGIAARTWGERNTMRIAHPVSRALPAFVARWLDMPRRSAARRSRHAARAGRRRSAHRSASRSRPGDEEHGYFMLAGGQSGHPLSPYYGAGHADWAAGKPTPFLPGPARAHADARAGGMIRVQVARAVRGELHAPEKRAPSPIGSAKARRCVRAQSVRSTRLVGRRRAAVATCSVTAPLPRGLACGCDEEPGAAFTVIENVYMLPQSSVFVPGAVHVTVPPVVEAVHCARAVDRAVVERRRADRRAGRNRHRERVEALVADDARIGTVLGRLHDGAREVEVLDRVVVAPACRCRCRSTLTATFVWPSVLRARVFSEFGGGCVGLTQRSIAGPSLKSALPLEATTGCSRSAACR